MPCADGSWFHVIALRMGKRCKEIRVGMGGETQREDKATQSAQETYGGRAR